MNNADGSQRQSSEIRDPYDAARLEQANSVLITFLPNAQLVAGPLGQVKDHAAIEWTGSPDLSHPQRTMRQAVVPNRRGSALTGPPGRIHFSCTAEEGIATLIRFVRGRTRRPLQWWRDRFSSDTYLTVLSTTYGSDAAKMACVLCGAATDSHDWWGTSRWDQGPCCSFGSCRARENSRAMMGGVASLDDLLGGLGGMDDRMIYRGTEVLE